MRFSASSLVPWKRVPSPNSRAGHPGWRRCSALKYSRYSRASRLAIRAPRSGTYATTHVVRALGGSMKTFAALLVGIGIGAGAMLAAQTTHKGGFIVQRDAEIAKNEPGTHNGGGQTIGFSFFDKTPGMKFVFRKRAF